MMSLNCKQCGLINQIADETCQRCGAELSSGDAGFNPGTSDYYQTPPANTAGAETGSGGFEAKPVIGPFTSIGDVLSPTIDLFKNNFWLITKIVFVIYAPFEIFKALKFDPEDNRWQLTVGTLLLGFVCKALVAPSLIYALVTVMRTGKSPGLQECYRWGLSRLGKLLICALMAWTLQIIGYACLIVPGIILGLAFELVYPMATLENRGPVEILKRSYKLTEGYRWNIFVANFVLGLLLSVVSVPLGLITSTLLSSGIEFWPIYALLGMISDIAGESATVLSLVIYISILSQAPANDAMPGAGAVDPHGDWRA